MSDLMKDSIFFVLKCFLNGEDGIYATDEDHRQMPDGWYYHPFNDEYMEPLGPFRSRDACIRDWQKRVDAMNKANIDHAYNNWDMSNELMADTTWIPMPIRKD